jgi:glycolate oxidase FAD binding subunit
MSEHTLPAPLQSLVDGVRAAAPTGTAAAHHRWRHQGLSRRKAARVDALSTTGWAGIVSHEPTELVITARAGTPLAELEAALAEAGQCLPFEPPHFGPAATVGGMVAAGLAGPARATAGSVRDYVLGVQLINGQGELLTFGGQVMKNVAGYDISRLMAGSRGQLGVIAEVSLKVLPVAPAEATLVFRWVSTTRWSSCTAGAASPCRSTRPAGCATRPPRPTRTAVRAPARSGGGGGSGLRAHAARTAGRSAHGQRAGLRRLGGLPRTDAAFLPGARAGPGPVAPVGAADRAGAGPALAAAGRVAGRAALALGAGDRGRRIRTATAASVQGHASLFRVPATGADGVARFDAESAAIRTISQRLRSAFDPAGVFAFSATKA